MDFNQKMDSLSQDVSYEAYNLHALPSHLLPSKYHNEHAKTLRGHSQFLAQQSLDFCNPQSPSNHSNSHSSLISHLSPPNATINFPIDDTLDSHFSLSVLPSEPIKNTYLSHSSMPVSQPELYHIDSNYSPSMSSNINTIPNSISSGNDSIDTHFLPPLSLSMNASSDSFPYPNSYFINNTCNSTINNLENFTTFPTDDSQKTINDSLESKKPLNKKFKRVHNDGFDNEDFDFICYTHDLILDEKHNITYEILNLVGQGTFGHVYRCFERNFNNSAPTKIVALKIIKNLPQYHDQALSEIKILCDLSNLKPHLQQGFIRMTRSFYYHKHLCIVTEILQENMYQILKKTLFNGIPLKFVQQIAAQMIRNIYILEHLKITHGDIKPENVMIEKLVDCSQPQKFDVPSNYNSSQHKHNSHPSRFFSSHYLDNSAESSSSYQKKNPENYNTPCISHYSFSNNTNLINIKTFEGNIYNPSISGDAQSHVSNRGRFYSENSFSYSQSQEIKDSSHNLEIDHFLKIKLIDFGSAHTQNPCMLSYIQSRFYRAPEVLLGLPSNRAIDIWSLGCLIFELLTGLPLFPGTSEFDQLQRITHVLGMPPSWMIEMGQHSSKYFYGIDNVYPSKTHFQKAKSSSSPLQRCNHMAKEGCAFKGIEDRSTNNKKWAMYTQAEYESIQQKKELQNQEYFPMNSLYDLLDSNHSSFSRLTWSNIDQIQTLKNFLDFLMNCLKIDPYERLTPEKALSHPFIMPIVKHLDIFQEDPIFKSNYPPSPASTNDEFSSYSPSLSPSSPSSPSENINFYCNSYLEQTNDNHLPDGMKISIIENQTQMLTSASPNRPLTGSVNLSPAYKSNYYNNKNHHSPHNYNDNTHSPKQYHIANYSLNKQNYSPSQSRSTMNEYQAHPMNNSFFYDHNNFSQNTRITHNTIQSLSTKEAQHNSNHNKFNTNNLHSQNSHRPQTYHRRTFGYLKDMAHGNTSSSAEKSTRYDSQSSNSEEDKLRKNYYSPNDVFRSNSSSQKFQPIAPHKNISSGTSTYSTRISLMAGLNYSNPNIISHFDFNEDLNADNIVSILSENSHTMDWSTAHSPYVRPKAPTPFPFM